MNIYLYKGLKLMNSKFLFLLITLFLSIISRGQTKFTEGYFIDNNNNIIQCFIRNIGNEESTMNYQYRLKNDKEIKKIELSRVKEFGIDDEMKCIRALISVDVSPSRIPNLKDTVIDWEEGHAFLKILVEGELATLYSYYDHGKPLFFFRIGNSSVEPLFYKKYYLEVTTNIIDRTLVNKAYIDQLKEYLACGDTDEIKKVSYTKKALVKYFIDYHKCKGSDYLVYKSAQINRGSFRFKLGINVNSLRMDVEEYSDALPNILFSRENSLGFGLEAEYVLPFNRYKWSIFAESNFYSYYSDKIENEPNPALFNDQVVDYKTIEVPIGITHYMNIDENNRLFIRCAFVPHFIFDDSYIAFSDVYHSDFSPSSRLLFGSGYNYKRLGLEFRYYSNQNITMNIYKRNSDLSQISLRVYYTLFNSSAQKRY